MSKFQRRSALLLIVLILAGAALPARSTAAVLGHGEATFFSGAGAALYGAAGVLLPLAEDGSRGRAHSVRTADALITSFALSEGLKRVIRERRPDGNGDDSMPSGHATAAFAIAAMQSHFHPAQAPLWYLGAGLIAESRVDLRRHRYADVLAGAALGYLTARWELSQRHGLVLAPVVGDGAFGLALGARF
jgi:membrane-associated phospholipid phosphatase